MIETIVSSIQYSEYVVFNPSNIQMLSMLECNTIKVLFSHTKACKHRSEIDNGKPTQ